MKLFIVALFVGLACAAPSREKRQAVCADPFANVPSPCANNPTNKVYFPHPTDATKFLQCDIYDRMYIIQCPMGEVFDTSLTACRPANPATAAPVTAAPVTAAPVTAAPVTAAPLTAAPQGVPVGNPCALDALARGQYYFPVPNKAKFIECDLAGNPNLMDCPSGLVWEQGLLSCVYPLNAGGLKPVNPVTQIPGQLANPCTAQAINSGHFFFPYPGNNSKFIQCDLWGQVFEVDCPAGLKWNAYQETCYQPNAFTG